MDELVPISGLVQSNIDKLSKEAEDQWDIVDFEEKESDLESETLDDFTDLI